MTGQLLDIQLPTDAPISAAVGVIEKHRFKIALVVSETGRLLGTITDGDVRRGLLRGESLHSPVSRIMNTQPITLPVGERSRARETMLRRGVLQIPLIDKAGHVARMEVIGGAGSVFESGPGHTVVIMAGGEGKRMRPFTEVVPKPMLQVGGRPMLETIIDNFARAGLNDFVLSVNYRAEVIKDHFGDGSGHGVSIRYLDEPIPLGTAGALKLLNPKPVKAIIVVNGDVLTNLNFQNMLDFHAENEAQITIALQRYRHTIPFGVVEVDGESITSIREKPTLEFFVNAGIYVIEPAAIDAIPDGQPFDMPSLVDLVLAHEQRVAAFPILEYWIDVGHAADLTRATMEYDANFGVEAADDDFAALALNQITKYNSQVS